MKNNIKPFQLEVLHEHFTAHNGRRDTMHQLLETVLIIEQICDIIIPDKDIREENFATLENTVQYLQSKQ